MASLNLHCGRDSHGQPYDVAAAIADLDATVICLQEDWVQADGARSASPDLVTSAARAYGRPLHRAEMCAKTRHPVPGVPADDGPGRLYISVLTALPVTAHEVIALGHGPGDSFPRVAQVLTLQTPGGAVLRLVNTHLTFSVASPLQLWRLWRRLRTDPVPTVIAGDLNMPALVARRYAGLTGLVSGPTYPADVPVLQLDHILASHGVGPGRGAVLPPAGSDHRPVRARFRLESRC